MGKTIRVTLYKLEDVLEGIEDFVSKIFKKYDYDCEFTNYVCDIAIYCFYNVNRTRIDWNSMGDFILSNYNPSNFKILFLLRINEVGARMTTPIGGVVIYDMHKNNKLFILFADFKSTEYDINSKTNIKAGEDLSVYMTKNYNAIFTQKIPCANKYFAIEKDKKYYGKRNLKPPIKITTTGTYKHFAGQYCQLIENNKTYKVFAIYPFLIKS